jgi:N-acetylglucosaminyldiphosphoundecaprenol N-acetyl-beta-D-mannosaminyltransferase
LYKDPELKKEISENCTAVFDGIGMKIGFWIRGKGLLQDLNGTDLFPVVLKTILNTNKSIFLLGSEENVIRQAAENIKAKYPGVKISGFHSGFFKSEYELKIIKMINDSEADILIIGRGFPLEEKFSLKYKNLLRVSLIWNVGGLFDFISENKPRAPSTLRKMRLEWLYRFILEPYRMLHRNTVCAVWSLTNILFKKEV